MNLKFLKLFSPIFIGREIALAIIVLRLIAEAFKDTAPSDLARFVYKKLPKRWKSPAGPATEGEFLEMIKRGIDFYRSARRVLT